MNLFCISSMQIQLQISARSFFIPGNSITNPKFFRQCVPLALISAIDYECIFKLQGRRGTSSCKIALYPKQKVSYLCARRLPANKQSWHPIPSDFGVCRESRDEAKMAYQQAISRQNLSLSNRLLGYPTTSYYPICSLNLWTWKYTRPTTLNILTIFFQYGQNTTESPWQNLSNLFFVLPVLF